VPAKNNAPRKITWKGKTQTLVKWAADTGVPEATIRARLDRLGWSVERALTTAPDRKFSRSPGRPAKDAPRSAPKLKKHAKGQAYVKWMENGNRHQKYFGPWGSAKARDGYARFLRQWSAGITASKSATERHRPGTVGTLLIAWLDHAKARYVKFGKQTSEFHCHRAACNVVLDRYEKLPVSEFGLEQLEAVRADMIDLKKWARKTVNNHVARIVMAFGWGVPRKLVPADVHYALQQVEPIAPGKTAAPERVPVRSAPVAHVEAVLVGEYLHPDPGRRAVLSAMVRVHLFTGMRPNELCAMRPEHLDRTASEWKYTVPPTADKNYHREGDRAPIWLGPRAQEVLAPLVAAAEVGKHTIFAFPRQRRKSEGPRPVSRLEYARLIAAACKRANVPAWHPHQLRHNRATELRRLYESNAVAARGIGTTEDVAARIYTDPQEAVDRRIARETG
jgi:integrase